MAGWIVGFRGREIAKTPAAFCLVQLDGVMSPSAETGNTRGTTRFKD